MDLQELEETAGLAHLNVSRDELEAALPAFEQMIGFFAAMQEADNDTAFIRQDTASLERSYPSAGARLVGAGQFRFEDNDALAVPGTGTDLNEKLLNNPGERDGRFFVIPNVL